MNGKQVDASRARGFTLIELMITVAIVAILAAIAYPSYTEFVLRGKRAEGRAALMDMMQQQERYFTQIGNYATISVPPAPNQAIKNFSGDSVASAAYYLSADVCPAPLPSDMKVCVQASATPRGSDLNVGTLTITSTGRRDCTGSYHSTPAKCWQ